MIDDVKVAYFGMVLKTFTDDVLDGINEKISVDILYSLRILTEKDALGDLLDPFINCTVINWPKS